MKKIGTLETLRGLAAISVAIFHFPSTSFLNFPHGLYAVYFFFTLSGFIISYSYFSKINNFNDLLKFQKKRFFRIYPVHFFMIIIVLLIQILKYIVIEFTSLPYGGEAFGDWYTLKDLILNIFLLQSIFDYGYWISWNGVAWSISTEFYTYLIFGFLLMISRGRTSLLSILLILYFVIFFLFFDELDSLFNVVFLQCIFSFFCGSFVYIFYLKTIKLIKINDFTFGIIFSILFFYAYNNFTLKDAIYLNIIFSILIFLFAKLENNSIIFKIMNYRYFVLLGTISYSFYMVHQSILYLYIQFLKFIVKVSFVMDDGIVLHTGNNLNDTLITVSYLIITFVISMIMHKFIEEKFRI